MRELTLKYNAYILYNSEWIKYVYEVQDTYNDDGGVSLILIINSFIFEHVKYMYKHCVIAIYNKNLALRCWTCILWSD